MIGDLCTQTSDCCGVKDQAGSIKTFNGGLDGGTGPSTDVQCQKAAGATFGVCNYVDTVCSAAGQLCKPGKATSGGAMSCSTKDDCCAGNDNTFPTCQIDANGIPRCTIMSNLDCTAGPPPAAGSACASSADCCGNPCIANPGGSPAFVCGTPGQCQAQGQSCTSTADCCPGLPCAVPPGSSTGICGGTVEPDGGVTNQPPPGTDGGVIVPPGPDAGPDAGAGADAGPPGVCALYGQSCTKVPCCDGVPCASGTCHFP
jgi:hypothetical protein